MVEGKEPAIGKECARRRLGVAAGATVVVVLLGSRVGEIVRLGSPFGAALSRLEREFPGLLALVPVAHGVEAEARSVTDGWSIARRLLAVPEDAAREREKSLAFAAADVALAASGSVALELAAAGLPTVIGYRFAPLTWMVGRMLVRQRTASLVNILLCEEVQPEFLQRRCRPEPIAESLSSLLRDGPRRQFATRRLGEALERVGAGGPPPSLRAAEAVVELLDGRAAGRR